MLIRRGITSICEILLLGASLFSFSLVLVAMNCAHLFLRRRFFADFLSASWPPGFWHTMRTFYDGDGYPSLGLYFKAFDVAVSCDLHIPVYL